ncbi:MAG: aldehyde-activating protein [Hyphomicrobiales bacterium]|nr:GFA family protein [Hyphomicrobiales bacterium]PCJ87587.1 MAG: aldehyde-activating protein [Hyphomicrobiales bacterium]
MTSQKPKPSHLTDLGGLTGGCQCGAIRYQLASAPSFPHLCHCRMCQKAYGAPFSALCGIPKKDFKLTRGTPSIFKSSERVERGFCANCGTPLTFAYWDDDGMAISIGSLDEPEKVPPTVQCCTDSQLSWFATLARLPEQNDVAEMSRDALERLKSLQHPDFDKP